MKMYEKLEIEVYILQVEDVIRTSFDGYEDAKDDPFVPKGERTWY